MKNACRVLLLLVVVSLHFTAGAVPQALAQAETEPTGFENVRLWIYPEYDDPRLLVMLEGQIVGVEAPAKVRFLVPAAAQMYSAGWKDAQGRYTGGPPDREPSPIPGWDEISYTARTGTFRVEYYDPIIIGQPDKTISYEFRWLYPISRLTAIVQEPKRSSGFSVLPAGVPITDEAGFASHQYTYQDLDDEPPLSFEIAYTKSDPNPSLAAQDDGSSNALLVVVVIVALCAVAGAVFLVLRRPRTRARAGTRTERRHAARKSPVRGPKEKRLQRGFCSQCGKRVENSSRFCQYCGTEL
jgi:hypothetical protein